MPTDVEICNLALTYLGIEGILSSLGEQSAEAKACNRVYAGARDFVLRSHWWKFATKRVTLADLDDAPADWSYRYMYPSDCIQVQEILRENKETDDAIPYEVSISDDTANKTILCDKASAVLKYTVKITNAALFDAMFTDVLAWRIAFLTWTLTGSRKVQQGMQDGFTQSINMAWTADRNEMTQVAVRDAEHIRERD